MEHLTIVATIVAKKEYVEEVKKELLKLIPITLKEKGCISYDLHQSIEEPNVFVFYENWESNELLEIHLKNDHLVEYGKNTDGKIDEFIIKKMKHLSI